LAEKDKIWTDVVMRVMGEGWCTRVRKRRKSQGHDGYPAD
jgi:hypothetical protein